MKGAYLSGLLSLVLALPSAGQTASLEASVDTESISLGGRVVLSLAVEHSPNQTVLWPAPLDTLGAFEVLGVAEAAPVAVDGRSTSRLDYLLTAFELGELEIPPLEVAVVDSAGGDPRILNTGSIPITVESVGLDESGDIRTVKSPLEIPRNWLLMLPWLLLVAALCALAYWLYKRYKRRKHGTIETTKPAEPARPPHEVAYEALDWLEARGLIERGKIKEFFIEVSEIIRTYLEGRYGIDALEMTSFEVIRELERSQVERRIIDVLSRFLERSDLVKFAKLRPSPAASQEMIDIARKLVDDTKEVDVDDRENLGTDGDDGETRQETKRPEALVS